MTSVALTLVAGLREAAAERLPAAPPSGFDSAAVVVAEFVSAAHQCLALQEAVGCRAAEAKRLPDSPQAECTLGSLMSVRSAWANMALRSRPVEAVCPQALARRSLKAGYPRAS